MKVSRAVNVVVGLLFVATSIVGAASAQEKVRLSHSALETSNAVWFIAQELGFYKKQGLDSELLFIPSTTTSLTSLLAGDVHVANVSGGAVASAVLAGAQIAIVACYLNSLPYELVVNESIKSAEELKGKSLGISRLGSASDVAARALLRGLNLEPDKQVPIMQVGGSSERAAAFRAGRIAGFPVAAGSHSPDQRDAASNIDQHGGLQAALRVSRIFARRQRKLFCRRTEKPLRKLSWRISRRCILSKPVKTRARKSWPSTPGPTTRTTWKSAYTRERETLRCCAAGDAARGGNSDPRGDSDRAQVRCATALRRHGRRKYRP